MVRRNVEIKPIEDNAKRSTAFTKRRQGLFKKAREFCDSFGAEAAVIAFSTAGNVFAFGHPAVNLVIGRYLASPSSSTLAGDYGVEEGVAPLTDAEKVIAEWMENGRPAWGVTVRNLGLSELDELESNMMMIRRLVAGRAREVGGELSLKAGCLSPRGEES